ncbi:MAG: tetratricopeptide repeat protein [Pseudobdellovibrio sp.]
MKKTSEQWVIKFETEQVKGPYSTDAISKMIATGVFSGNEQICAYPEGEWSSLNKQPEFYEALLESLENPVEVDSKKAQKMEAETVVRIPEAKQKSEPLKNAPEIKALTEVEKKEIHKKEILEAKQQLKKEALKRSLQVDTNLASNSNRIDFSGAIESDIHLTDFKHIQKKEAKKFLPLILIIIMILAGISYLVLEDDRFDSTGWVLLMPKKTIEGKSSSDNKELKRKAVLQFQQSQLEGILLAQKYLIQAVEEAPRDLEAIGLLCMAHQQLWPYTKQTAQDMKSIMLTMQMARSINPISSYSESCQTSFLIAKGQLKEARSLVEKTLDHVVEDNFSLSPFLYLIKGEMFEYDQNTINAAAYYEQASKLWPKWIWPKFGLARMNFKLGKFAEARTEYQGIFDLDKESKAALYGLALVEIKGFKNIDKANQYFSTGYQLKQILPKNFHVEALLSYAQLLIDKNNRSKALEVAQKGYQINPSHRALKEMVLTLGGSDKVENSQSEIILLGDQFSRSGDHLAAVAQYKAAFELDPGNSTAALNAAKSLWALNQSREAINWLQKAIQVDPKLIQAYTLKADYESQRYSFVEAAKTLQEASKRVQQNYEVLKGQALLEFRKNNIIGAIQYGERAYKAYDADVELLTLLAQAQILFYLNQPSTGKNALDQKNTALKEAQRLSGKAIDLEPSWPDSQITYAKYLSAADGPMRGEAYLKNLIKNFPYTNEYRLGLAEYYKTEEKFADAADVYQQVVDLEPKNKKANFGLAESYRVLNKTNLAQRYYNATSILDPSDVEPLFSNAKLLLETAFGAEAKAKISQAVAKFNVVKEINPNYPRVSYYLAKSYLELGDFQKAIDLVKEEKTKNPNLADPFLLAAEIYYRKEQFKECAAEYSMAIKLRPSSAELYVKSSICYRKSDAIDIAEDMLVIAEQKESGYPDIYREHGYIFEKKGLSKEASAAFEKYLELSPNAPDRRSVELRIKK